jgi:hypothetical protein
MDDANRRCVTGVHLWPAAPINVGFARELGATTTDSLWHGQRPAPCRPERPLGSLLRQSRREGLLQSATPPLFVGGGTAVGPERSSRRTVQRPESKMNIVSLAFLNLADDAPIRLLVLVRQPFVTHLCNCGRACIFDPAGKNETFNVALPR